MLSTERWGKFSEADYKTPEQFCAACLVDENESGKPKAKAKCHLPVKEPDGNYNRNGLAAAAAALAGARGGVNLPLAVKRGAARKLLGLYQRFKMEPPDSLRRLAGAK